MADETPEGGSAGDAPHRIAAVILAAGASVRAGGRNKLLLDVDGTPMVRRVVEAARQAALDPLVVVTGHDADAVRAALDGLDAVFVHNAAASEGMAGSLARGLEGVTAAVDGALILLGDMPWVGPHHLRALVAAFDPARSRDVCVPVHGGRRGNPVLWGARHFGEMGALSGDVGARALLERHADRLVEVDVEDPGVLRDVDTLAEWRGLVDGGRIRRS